jgi:phosphoribosylanthranilate isomerase
MTRLKLCGLMRAADAEAVSAVRPELAGMILSPGFRRSVTPETASEIRRALDRQIPAVGVFVNAQIAQITAFAARDIIQLVQLHGTEDDAYILQLRRVCTLPVIKAFRIQSAEDAQKAAQSDADLVLLDSGTGTGQTFDWSLLKGFPRPYFLAGGLNPDNAAAAIGMLHPYGIDVSSGIETDGQKDPEKIRRFAEIVRQTG